MTKILNPNCSEACFRFHTTDTKKMQYILQAISDEVGGCTVPLKKKAIDYQGKGLFSVCAGLGENATIIRVNPTRKSFTLNIGNNDISDNKTGWIEKIKKLGIKVDEAEFDKSLQAIARDCTCGITYGFGGPKNLGGKE